MTAGNITLIQLDDPVEDAAQYLTDYFQKLEQSFILLSGGSAIKMYQRALELCDTVTGHTFGLVDERYGKYGHENSNEQQLRQIGLIDEIERKHGKFVGILSPEDKSLDETAAEASQIYDAKFEQHQNIILLLGIGPDGHTAGWLPTKSAQKFDQLYNSQQSLVAYQVSTEDSNNPHTERITLSYGKYLKLMASEKKIAPIVFAVGKSKHEMLKRFVAGEGEIHRYPMLGLLCGEVVLLSDVT